MSPIMSPSNSVEFVLFKGRAVKTDYTQNDANRFAVKFSLAALSWYEIRTVLLLFSFQLGVLIHFAEQIYDFFLCLISNNTVYVLYNSLFNKHSSESRNGSQNKYTFEDIWIQIDISLHVRNPHVFGVM